MIKNKQDLIGVSINTKPFQIDQSILKPVKKTIVYYLKTELALYVRHYLSIYHVHNNIPIILSSGII